MNSRYLNDIKAEALRLGFFACGVSRASRVAEKDIEAHLATMRDGGFGGMSYLEENLEKRFDPTLLVPNAKSIISVALNYNPQQRIPSDHYQIATYAYGHDYHDVMKGMLHQLASQLGLTDYRAFCDTAPVLERYWAVQAGIGWIGRNHQLIVPGAGSRVFLGEIITTEELPASNESLAPRCGECTACIDACPTQALAKDTTEDKSHSTFDASRCLSYLTIENRGEIPAEAADKMGHCFYGCDRCTDVCPWNKNAEPTHIAAFQPSQELLQMKDEDWHRLNEDDYRRLFKGSAVKRAKYEGLKRNIKAMKTLLLILLLILMSACKAKKHHERIYSNDYSELLCDSVVPSDSIEQDNESTATTYDVPSSSDYEDEPQHRGTPPDDNMYGFDPLDDVDDEWNLEHFNDDPYPDDDY